jgi:hypothetical protein
MSSESTTTASLAESPPKARHVEIWGHILDQNRFLRRLVGGALVLAYLGLAAGAYGFYVGVYQPLAYHVDATGEATAVGRLRAAVGAPVDGEVRYVTKEFLRRRLAWNSMTVEADLAAAENLMTESARADSDRFLEDYEKQFRRPFVADLKTRQLQTRFEFDDARFEVQSHDDRIFTVRIRGRRHILPLNSATDEVATKDEDFEALLTLVTCARSERTPNGLLVDKFAFRTFEPAPRPLLPDTTTNTPSSEVP